MCDNVSAAHNPIIIQEDMNAMRWLCTECKQQGIIRKEADKGVPEKREYIRVFRREAFQGNDNLFYKYYPQFLTQ